MVNTEKLKAFASWLRTKVDGKDPFHWLDGRRCVASYAGRWSVDDNSPLVWNWQTKGSTPVAFVRIFGMHRDEADDLWVGGRGVSCNTYSTATFAQVADVIDGIADGLTVDQAMVDVFIGQMPCDCEDASCEI